MWGVLCLRHFRYLWSVSSSLSAIESCLIPSPCLHADLLAVPKHPYAAMENWGLSVFVEQKILLDPEVSSFSYQMELTMVVVHEICHQVTAWNTHTTHTH